MLFHGKTLTSQHINQYKSYSMKPLSLISILIVVLMAFSSCATKRLTPEQKLAMQDSVARMVSDSITSRKFTVEVNYVNPQRMEARFLNSTYTVRIKGDSIMSNLPYYGVAYRATMEREGPLDFDGNIQTYTILRPKPDLVRVKFFTRNKLEYIEYIFDFSPDGKCSLDVLSADRDKINFLGEMLL